MCSAIENHSIFCETLSRFVSRHVIWLQWKLFIVVLILTGTFACLPYKAATIDLYKSECNVKGTPGQHAIASACSMHLDCFGLDCMTRHRHNQLVRELWRLRASLTITNAPLGGDGPDMPAPATNQDRTTSSSDGTQHDMKLKSALNSTLKRLNVDELELLLESVKSKGRAHSHCIHLSRTRKKHSEASSDTPVSGEGLLTESRVICQTWRWPDLMDNVSLKQLPCCQIPLSDLRVDSSQEESDSKQRTELSSLCINPYHWSKVFYLRGK